MVKSSVCQRSSIGIFWVTKSARSANIRVWAISRTAGSMPESGSTLSRLNTLPGSAALSLLASASCEAKPSALAASTLSGSGFWLCHKSYRAAQLRLLLRRQHRADEPPDFRLAVPGTFEHGPGGFAENLRLPVFLQRHPHHRDKYGHVEQIGDGVLAGGDGTRSRRRAQFSTSGFPRDRARWCRVEACPRR